MSDVNFTVWLFLSLDFVWVLHLQISSKFLNLPSIILDTFMSKYLGAILKVFILLLHGVSKQSVQLLEGINPKDIYLN